MNTDIVREIYFESIRNRSDKEGLYDQSVSEENWYRSIEAQKPEGILLKEFNKYRKNNEVSYNLDKEISINGFELKKGTILFHGNCKEIIKTIKPTSWSTSPAIAVWHARKHRNHELNGKPIYIHILKIVNNTKFKACAYFKSHEFSQEKEVLLQSSLDLNLIAKEDISSKVYVMEFNV